MLALVADLGVGLGLCLVVCVEGAYSVPELMCVMSSMPTITIVLKVTHLELLNVQARSFCSVCSSEQTMNTQDFRKIN